MYIIADIYIVMFYVRFILYCLINIDQFMTAGSNISIYYVFLTDVNLNK